MITRRPSAEGLPATYEICLQGSVPEFLRRRYPQMTSETTPAQTVLFRCVEELEELDVLLDRLSSLGLVLVEIHEAVAVETWGSRNYEVRVRGQLGERLLRSLGWSHCVLPPEQQLVWDKTTPDALSSFLAECSDSGLTIERVHRIGPIR
jgi:hypothetical protein